MSNLVKSLGYIKYHRPSSIKSIKSSLLILTVTAYNFRSSTVDWQDLKPYRKLEKTAHFSR